MHQFVLSASKQKARGVRALDIAKRILDFGMHAPTTYFPLIVDEALMVEPTETETKAGLDAYADVPINQIGSIAIPKINLLHPIFEGVWLTVVDHGPGHWPGTAMPGAAGNAVFAGHRVTHTHPFLNVDQLRNGDQVIFHMPNGDFTYAVTQVLVVDPNAIWITNPTRSPTITLFACHPKHSAAQRIVVKGKLVRSVPSSEAVSGARDAGQRAAAVGL